MSDQKCIYWNETFRLIFKHRVVLNRKRNDLFNVGNFEAFLWLSFQRSGIRRVTTDKFYVRYVSYDITVECFKRLSLFQASTAFSTLWSLDMISLTSQECNINSSGTIIVVLSKLYYDYFRRSLSTRRKSDINSHRSAFTFSFNPQNSDSFNVWILPKLLFTNLTPSCLYLTPDYLDWLDVAFSKCIQNTKDWSTN